MKIWVWLSNLPIPEAHVIGIIIGLAAHFAWPRPLPLATEVAFWPGLALVTGGLLLATWAVRSAGRVRLARPSQLVTQGAYAISRNPIYLAWALIHLGIALATASIWLLLTLVAAVLYMHLREIPAEERVLVQQFGSEYAAYRRRVRRWF